MTFLLRGTVADAQAAIEKTLKVRAGEIAAAANAQSRGRGIVGGKARSVQWVSVRCEQLLISETSTMTLPSISPLFMIFL